ncbi:NUDIX domain-containing protein [Patescibacteria group bacterium]|nr:NUDIX domain-containing protein [Patescibacteria group bacterium]
MKESQHFCVTDVFLENELGEILMIKRDESKEILPNVYNGLGGKFEAGETPLQAVLREAKEEAGVKNIKNLQLKANLSVKDKFGFWQIYIFYGNVKKQDVEIKDNSEGILEWIPKNKMGNYDLTPDTQQWLPEMLAKPEIFQFVKVEYDDEYKILNINIKSLN